MSVISRSSGSGRRDGEGTWQRLMGVGYASSLYRMTLRGRVPDRLAAEPEDPWPGDPAIGNALFQGRYRFVGREARAPNQPPWRLLPHDGAWTRELHSFEWLRHFAAASGPTAQQHARRLLRSWIDLADSWDAVSWAPDVVGRRVVAWVSHGAFLLRDAEPGFRSAVFNSLARQLRHLGRTARSANPGRGSLQAAAGLIIGALCLPGEAARAERGLALLRRELAWQILPDGGHVSRSPGLQFAILRDLIGLRHALSATEQDSPVELQTAIDRMAPMLRAFRAVDGGLVLFNGSYEESAERIDVTLSRADAKGKAISNASHVGYQRLAAQRSLVVVDTGSLPDMAFREFAYSGCLSFEFGANRHRIVVNCGSGMERSDDWVQAARATAAHSTITIDDTNSAAMTRHGGSARGPGKVTVTRDEDTGSIWLDAAHDGYVANFGVTHRRRLFLDASGEDLRGEDVLSGPAGRRFAVRFQLHPDIQASMVQGGAQVLLKLPDGAGWRFRAGGGAVSLDESVYLGRRDAVRRSLQIVLTGTMQGDETTARWTFKRV